MTDAKVHVPPTLRGTLLELRPIEAEAVFHRFFADALESGGLRRHRSDDWADRPAMRGTIRCCANWGAAGRFWPVHTGVTYSTPE